MTEDDKKSIDAAREKLRTLLCQSCEGLPYLKPGENEKAAIMYNGILPFLIGSSTLYYVFANPCFNPRQALYVKLFWGMWSLFMLIFLVGALRSILYIRNSKFCTPNQRERHRWAQWGFMLSLGASFDYYQVYAQNVKNWGYALGSGLLYLLSFCLYIGCFWTSHLRQCGADSHNTEGSLSDSTCVRILDFIWTIGIFLVIGISFGYHGELYDDNWRVLVSTTCVPYNSTD